MDRGGVAATVHPHARGDHSSSASARARWGGSPPRPWGPRGRGIAPSAGDRFTPTPVGTTFARLVVDGVVAVHPHARGDHSTSTSTSTRRVGSPPRPWGPLGRVGIVVRIGRFTPTPVGTTRSAYRSRGHHPVHPHARGDHIQSSHRPFVMVGSPPRPWGPPARPATRSRTCRFTPTPVGTTRGRSACCQPQPVHPHARGDHVIVAGSVAAMVGSPPRPWGPHLALDLVAVLIRFTPTPVGTTLPKSPLLRRSRLETTAEVSHGSSGAGHQAYGAGASRVFASRIA